MKSTVQWAGAPPSGVNVMGCHVRSLRTHGALAPVECQELSRIVILVEMGESNSAPPVR
jgi:hypothetical protein